MSEPRLIEILDELGETLLPARRIERGRMRALPSVDHPALAPLLRTPAARRATCPGLLMKWSVAACWILPFARSRTAIHDMTKQEILDLITEELADA